MPVRHLIRELTIPPALKTDHTVMDAVRNMIDFDTGAVVISATGGRVIGIFTKKDLLGKVTALNRSPKTTPLGDVMSTDVITASETVSIGDCLRIMAEYRVRHLPIVRSGEIYCGLVALCDILNVRISEMTQDIHSLESYLNDAPGG